MAISSKQLVLNFVTARNADYQSTMTDKDLDKYISFLSDELVDFHAAYNVTQKGTEKLRQGFKNKAKHSVRYQAKAEEIIIGSHTTVFTLIEDSEYYKRGKLKQFKGRTITVLEFDDKGLIKHMRRYLDH